MPPGAGAAEVKGAVIFDDILERGGDGGEESNGVGNFTGLGVVDGPWDGMYWVERNAEEKIHDEVNVSSGGFQSTSEIESNTFVV